MDSSPSQELGEYAPCQMVTFQKEQADLPRPAPGCPFSAYHNVPSTSSALLKVTSDFLMCSLRLPDLKTPWSPADHASTSSRVLLVPGMGLWHLILLASPPGSSLLTPSRPSSPQSSGLLPRTFPVDVAEFLTFGYL